MSAIARRLGGALAGLADRGLLRERRILDGPQGPRVRVAARVLVNFASNDYLGLASHPRLREAAHRAIDLYGVGSGASPLVIGHSALHEEAENRFAKFSGLPRALLFSSGYAANLGILATLAQRDAEIFSDALNHACLIDGARLSRARVTPFTHRDLAELEAKLAQSTAADRIVATDAVFSMDGDLAPLPGMLELCERHDAWLVIDDAHGVGVIGARGRGSLEHFGLRSPRIVLMATLGKALGGYGAFVAGEEETIEWLLQRARTYVYSTALPPMAAAVAMESMALVESGSAGHGALRERITQWRSIASQLGLAADSQSAIHPIVLGGNDAAVAASAALRDEGFLVPAIRPPTVPEGTARLRVSLSAAHEAEDLEGLGRALGRCLAR
jgi:8-amino-7-oxononanoate synthase